MQDRGCEKSFGTSQRAPFLIDKQGVIRYIDAQDINERLPLENLIRA